MTQWGQDPQQSEVFRAPRNSWSVPVSPEVLWEVHACLIGASTGEKDRSAIPLYRIGLLAKIHSWVEQAFQAVNCVGNES